MKNTFDMTKGKCWKNILIFAIPIFFSNLLQQLYHSVDIMIVGNFVSDNALSAVSSSGRLIFMFTSFFIGTASGAGVLISRYFGSKSYEQMQKTIHTDVAFGLATSVILTIVGSLISPYLLKLIKTDPKILPEAITYFRFYFIGITGVIMYNIFNGILQALGNSKRSLIYLAISSVLNIVLDLLFIIVFKMGVAGAAIATSISQFTSALLCFLFLIKKGTIYQIEVKKIKFHLPSLKLIIQYGVPAGIQNSVIAIANVFVQSNINSFGDIATGGCGIYATVEGFAFIPVNSFTMSLTTFVGQNLGAKEYERAKHGSRFGIICSMILAQIIGLVMFFFMPYIARLYSKTPELIALASRQAKFNCLFYFLLAFSHCVASVCRGAGKAIIAMMVMLTCWCLIRVAYIEIALHYVRQIEILFTAYPITWTLSSIVYFIYYFFSDWIHGFEKKKIKQID